MKKHKFKVGQVVRIRKVNLKDKRYTKNLLDYAYQHALIVGDILVIYAKDIAEKERNCYLVHRLSDKLSQLLGNNQKPATAHLMYEFELEEIA